MPITFLDTRIPIIFYTDATFNSMINYYEEFTNVSSFSIHEGNYLEKKALNNATKVIYSSDWAKESAINFYKINPSKISVINFGLNLCNNFTMKDVLESVDKKNQSNIIKLFFMGVDFKRKGGDKAVQICKYINDMGYKCELFLAGDKYNTIQFEQQYIHNIGYLNKNIEKDNKIITEMYRTSHFFLLPTRSEAYGIVFAEASSYGLPSITTNTGGVSSVVKNGLNGFTLDVDEDVSTFGNLIINLFLDKKEYKHLAKNTFLEYENRLNWNVVEKEILEIFKGISDNEK